MVLTSLAMAFLIGAVAESENVINIIVNVTALAVSFLGGVFTPTSVLDKGILKFSRILPVYWYEVNNTLLAEHTSLNAAQMQQLLEGYGLLVLFAAALVGAGMVISKMREKEA